eukprot:1947361-Pyramimonas_sp.AAC.1
MSCTCISAVVALLMSTWWGVCTSCTSQGFCTGWMTRQADGRSSRRVRRERQRGTTERSIPMYVC